MLVDTNKLNYTQPLFSRGCDIVTSLQQLSLVPLSIRQPVFLIRTDVWVCHIVCPTMRLAPIFLFAPSATRSVTAKQ